MHKHWELLTKPILLYSTYCITQTTCSLTVGVMPHQLYELNKDDQTIPCMQFDYSIYIIMFDFVFFPFR